MVEITRYRLMPATFNSTSHGLELPEDSWPDDVKALHLANRDEIIRDLTRMHGEACIERVVPNILELGQDPWSILGWHNYIWLEIRHAFVTGCYYSAALAAGGLGERIVNHLLDDLADECGTAEDVAKIRAAKPPMFDHGLGILDRWGVLEPAAHHHLERLRKMRNKLVHYDPDLYGRLRERSLEVMRELRDAINAQFGVFVQRRVIPVTHGEMYLRDAVTDEPFIRTYVLPTAMLVSPAHTIGYDQGTGAWFIDTNPPVHTEENTDERFMELRARASAI